MDDRTTEPLSDPAHPAAAPPAPAPLTPASPPALTLDQAKQRLRTVWGEHGPSAWVRRHPFEAALTALTAGVVVAMASGRRHQPPADARPRSRVRRAVPEALSGLGTQLVSNVVQSLVAVLSAAWATAPSAQDEEDPARTADQARTDHGSTGPPDGSGQRMT